MSLTARRYNRNLEGGNGSIQSYNDFKKNLFMEL